ncbi:MAG TPA: Uma2 family endonuclease [Gemmataceae bacterium]|nr:Uma2 family endonuclease [Gemmataceae bacterium]
MSFAVTEPVQALRTLAELMDHLGGIPAARIRLHPTPGTATAEDAFAVKRNEDRLCEVIDGVLVEKATGYFESWVALILSHAIMNYLDQNDLGIVTGSAGPLFVEPGQMRLPDLAFFSWDKFPNRLLPRNPILDHVPDLSVEVLSASNTPREMERKRRENFAGGARIVWEIDPEDRWIRVYTSVDQFTPLRDGDALDGGDVLPGFTLAVTELFDRAGRRE